MRCVRRSARTTHPRSRLRALLGGNSPNHAAALRSLWRIAYNLAPDGGGGGPVRPLPEDPSCGGSGARSRPLRWSATGDRPRTQIRRSPIRRASARTTDADTRSVAAGRGELRRSGTAASVPSTRTRVQSSGRPGGVPRASSRACLAPSAADAKSNGVAGRSAAQERATCVRHHVDGRDGAATRGRHRGTRGRREHDRSDAGSVCADAQGGRDQGSARAHSGPGGCTARKALAELRHYVDASRALTAASTSCAMASFARSPSTTSQPGSAACRR